MNRAFSPRTVYLSVATAVAAATLTGCYVVPMAPPAQVGPPQQAIAISPMPPVPPAPPAPTSQSFTARLYPSNAEAARYGAVTGVVTSDLNGRGHFSAVIGGEQFQGEATRTAGSQRNGIANAAGAKGGILSCRYTMNSTTLGAGNCTLNGGPEFTMHIGG